MKFGILYKLGNQKAHKVAESAKDYLLKNGHEVFGEDRLKNSEIILTFGGDGTLTHKASQFAYLGVPFVGINTGNLGFLTAADANNFEKVVDLARRGELYLSKRITLEVSLENGKDNYVAVNDAVIKSQFRVIGLDLTTNGQDFLKIAGDGVIIATQTGSTAYSLSAGGPIVDPSVDAILVTPINPIGLPTPSFVVSSGDQIIIKLVRGSDVWLVLDGQEHKEVSMGQSIKVSRGKHDVVFGYLTKEHFLKALNAKFGLSSRAGG